MIVIKVRLLQNSSDIGNSKFFRFHRVEHYRFIRTAFIYFFNNYLGIFLSPQSRNSKISFAPYVKLIHLDNLILWIVIQFIQLQWWNFKFFSIN